MTILRSFKTMKLSAGLLGIAFGLTACATTQSTPKDDSAMMAALAEAETMTTSTAESDDTMICKKTTVVGSKFNKRVCATKAQWLLREEEDRLATETLQRDRTGSQGRG